MDTQPSIIRKCFSATESFSKRINKKISIRGPLFFFLAFAFVAFFPRKTNWLSEVHLHRKPHVTLIIVSDREHLDKYASQARSIQCYANTHGYDFVTLEPESYAPDCKTAYRIIQFQKPCTVGQWLLTQPENAEAVVFDGDVIGGTSNISLSQWLKKPYGLTYDLAFYERSWNFEVMSGNYVIRNTPFTRLFMHHWASFDTIRPKGYDATDNGAIHLAILDALGIRGRQRCLDLYRALEAPVTNLFPYFEFVACTKALLGPPRVYEVQRLFHLQSTDSISRRNSDVFARIVIFPRFFGFVEDAYVHGMVAANQHFPFHHGLKKDEWKDVYLDFKDRGKNTGCRAFTTNNTMSTKEMAKRIRDADLYSMQTVGQAFSQVPRWLPANKDCYEELWCPPLPPNPSRWPVGLIESNGKLVQYEYSDPGADFHNLLISGLFAQNQ
ncbi:hypothetical protein FGB62_26g34 [Gracilaria domingensis]|nr:hypothetical protein FGB62_26g34 [Gracilaria domingensis]